MTSKIKIYSNIKLECDNSEVISKVINDNTFENPIYVSNEENGRSNWQTNKFIETYHYHEDSLILPRGYMRGLLEILHDHALEFDFSDERFSLSVNYKESLKDIRLRDYQKRAVSQTDFKDQGCIVSPTGSGKSLIGLEIIRKKGQKALILVHRGELARQWIEVIQDKMDIEAGFIGNGEWKVGDQITVAMVQTLATRENEAKALTNAFGLVLVDEGHHLPCSTFFNVISNLSAKYRYMLSATPNRRDGLENVIYRAIGPIIEEIKRSEVEDVGATVPAKVKAIETGFSPNYADSWHEYLTQATSDGERNDLIIKISLSQSSPSLILTDRVGHAEQLSEMLNRRNVDHVLAHGKIKDRSELFSKIKESQITVGTTSLLGEGIDICAWSVLIMASPISSETKLLQAVGRIVRSSVGKQEATVYDLRDDCGFSGASFKKRFEIYKKHKIWVEFTNKKAA